jgi:hypothetical protein
VLTLCPPGYCAGSPQGLQDCARGRQGRLCGECQSGWSQSFGSPECRLDDECNDGPAWWTLGYMAALLYVLFFALRPAENDGKLSALLFFFQMADCEYLLLDSHENH